MVLSVSLVSWGLSRTRLLEHLELRTLDYRFAISTGRIAPSSEIAIIALDDESFARVRQPFIFWVPSIAEVTEKLIRNGARVVGIDVLQDISLEKFSPGHTRKMLRVTASGKVVLISFLDPAGRQILPYAPIRAIAGLENIGLANLTPDEDEVMRRQAIHLRDSEHRDIPCFPFLVAAKYLGGPIGQGEDGSYRVGARVIQDKSGFVSINYAGLPGTFQPFSFYKVLRQAEQNHDDFFKRNFSDKIVLLGRTDILGKDYFSTPYSVMTNQLMSGIEVTANIIDTVLQGRYLRTMGSVSRLLWVFFMSLIVALSCYRLKPFMATISSLAVLLFYLGLGIYFFWHFRYAMNLTAVLSSVPLMYGVTFVYRYLTVDRRMRQIRDTFGKLVSPSVEEKLWNENIQPVPGKGEERKVTVLFADINGFTPVSEQNPPGLIMEWLNMFYKEMVDAAYQNSGTVKLFAGDEIMVLYGAPQEESRQAFLAVKTAVEMIERLRDLKKRIPNFAFADVKIGVHTGEMVHGFLGSPSRMEYTVIGASVNLASRIENLNKRLGTQILISENVYKELGLELEGYELKNHGPQEIKGFERKVTVYEVWRKGDER